MPLLYRPDEPQASNQSHAWNQILLGFRNKVLAPQKIHRSHKNINDKKLYFWLTLDFTTDGSSYASSNPIGDTCILLFGCKKTTTYTFDFPPDNTDHPRFKPVPCCKSFHWKYLPPFGAQSPFSSQLGSQLTIGVSLSQTLQRNGSTI